MSEVIRLNVIVPTYNRAGLLRRTLESLANAEPAPNMQVLVTVVDNNSTDETARAAEECSPLFQHKFQFEYLFEPQQGRSAAINRALKKADADLVSMVDDDEEIAPDWYERVAELFSARWSEIDFAGGKVLPRWQSPPPAWITRENAVGLGWRDYGEDEWDYGEDTPILTGGHAVLKLKLFHELGFYTEALGATGKNLLSCEDDVMFDKLLAAKKHGIYDPRLVIYHYVPDHRTTRSYARQWLFGNGVSQFLVSIHHKPFPGKKIFGVPRFMYRQALEGLWQTTRARFAGRRAAAYAGERGFWVFAGYFYASNIKNSRLDEPLRFVFGKLVAPAAR